MFKIFLFDRRKTRVASFFLIILFLFFSLANSFVIISGAKIYYNNHAWEPARHPGHYPQG